MRLALPDLPYQRSHVGEVPNLGELAVFDAIKSELRNRHPTTGRLTSLEGPPVGTSDREVQRERTSANDPRPFGPFFGEAAAIWLFFAKISHF